MSQVPHLVWFKRDLRVADHAPLTEAARRGSVLPLFIIEPAFWHQSDADSRHFTFLQRGLQELRGSLGALGQPLIIRTGEAVEVLERLRRETGFVQIWSHQETGNNWTYQRDKAVARWARAQGVNWHETPCNGVVRRLKSRDEWDDIWHRRMKAPLIATPLRLRPIPTLEVGPIPSHFEIDLPADTSSGAQKGGERLAQLALDTFLHSRGNIYRGSISSPLKSAGAGSRLSPYLAWGHLSIRQVYNATQLKINAEEEGSFWRRSLESFESRLHWHCHFMQKLESRPDLEFNTLVPAYDDLDRHFDSEKFAAWSEGRTGFPLVDASMRCLNRTGWINFRMRALLISFACHDLWLPWREVSLHLARVFLDYEPGIHYPQIQMQAGVNGNRTLRIYHPVKGARDHDPQGHFVRRWLPELAGIGEANLFEPWHTPKQSPDYPPPICNHETRRHAVRAAVKTIRARDDTWEQAHLVWQQIGSRRQPEPRKPIPKKPSDQLSLGL